MLSQSESILSLGLERSQEGVKEDGNYSSVSRAQRRGQAARYKRRMFDASLCRARKEET